MSEQQVSDQRSDAKVSESAQDHVDDSGPHDFDNEPMVYETPHDYRASALRERERLLAQGADPDSIILISELPSHIPRREGESNADYNKRYSATLNAMIQRGVSIMNDKSIANVVASRFCAADGRTFDLGPGSGATKGEFREFGQWFADGAEAGQVPEVPEKWKKFEKPAGETSDL